MNGNLQKQDMSDQIANEICEGLLITAALNQPDVDHEEFLAHATEDLQNLDNLSSEIDGLCDVGSRKPARLFIENLDDRVRDAGRRDYEQTMKAAITSLESDEFFSLRESEAKRHWAQRVYAVAKAVAKKLFLRLEQEVEAGTIASFRGSGGKVASCTFRGEQVNFETRVPAAVSVTDDEETEGTERSTGKVAPEKTRQFFIRDERQLSSHGRWSRRKHPPAEALYTACPAELLPHLKLYIGNLTRSGVDSKYACVVLFDQYAIPCSTESRRKAAGSRSRRLRRPARRGRVLESRLRERLKTSNIASSCWFIALAAASLFLVHLLYGRVGSPIKVLQAEVETLKAETAQLRADLAKLQASAATTAPSPVQSREVPAAVDALRRDVNIPPSSQEQFASASDLETISVAVNALRKDVTALSSIEGWLASSERRHSEAADKHLATLARVAAFQFVRGIDQETLVEKIHRCFVNGTPLPPGLEKEFDYTSRGHTLRFFERLKTQCEQRIECRLVVGMRPGQTVRDGR